MINTVDEAQVGMIKSRHYNDRLPRRVEERYKKEGKGRRWESKGKNATTLILIASRKD